MWKALNYGEKVSMGDTLRYRSNSNSLLPENHTYLVLRTDQHYFEIIRKTFDIDPAEPPDRKVVRYIDIGYNVVLERWAEPLTA
jgi:hypothetical protein